MDTLLYPLVFLAWAVCITQLLLYKREPSSTLAWIFFVTLVPVGGPILFWIFGPQRLERKAEKRRAAIESGAIKLDLAEKELPRLKELPWEVQAVLNLASNTSDYEASTGNTVEFLPDPLKTLQAMRRGIQNAERFVHLEYYIISNDEVTEKLGQDLVDAAKRGVEVRVLYDSFGSLSLKKFTLRHLTEAGVKIAGFLPFRLIPQHFNFNFRNHRKILIVDGTQAFTGGVNIGKKYLGRRTKNQWHDYSVKLVGPACRQLQDVFAKDWAFTTQEDLFLPKYYPPPNTEGKALIQVLESGPDTPFHSLHLSTFLAITSAKQEIILTTPYFIPDPAIKTSLMVAAMRGVKVKLILPAKSDAPLVQMATRSFYLDLLKSGVEIFEFQPRILHAKMLVVDQTWTMLGSANMDIRSFRLNFELNLMIHNSKLAAQCRATLEEDIEDSLHITLEGFSSRSIGLKIAENACRLLSPVL